MRISREKLLIQAELTGFRAEILEKVIYLLSLLEALNSHPFLKGRVRVKGWNRLEPVYLSFASSFGRYRLELHWCS